MYDQVIVIGNLVADPTLSKTNDGTYVVNMNVIVRRVHRDRQRDGVLYYRYLYYRVSVFGPRALQIHKDLRKGDMVQATGRLSYDSASGGPRQTVIPPMAYDMNAHSLTYLVWGGIDPYADGEAFDEQVIDDVVHEAADVQLTDNAEGQE